MLRSVQPKLEPLKSFFLTRNACHDLHSRIHGASQRGRQHLANERKERAWVLLSLALQIVLPAGALQGAKDHGLEVAVELVWNSRLSPSPLALSALSRH